MSQGLRVLGFLQLLGWSFSLLVFNYLKKLIKQYLFYLNRRSLELKMLVVVFVTTAVLIKVALLYVIFGPGTAQIALLDEALVALLDMLFGVAQIALLDVFLNEALFRWSPS